MGKARSPNEWRVATMEVEDMGYKETLISPLNGDYWIIASKSEHIMAKLIMDDELWLREWLEEWHPWIF